MKEKIILEIRAAEGGREANSLVVEMLDMYQKSAKLNNFNCQVLDQRLGFTSLCLGTCKHIL